MELRQALGDSTDDWATAKRHEVDILIASCAALYLESSTTSAVVTPGQPLPIKLEAINRSKVSVKLISARAAISGEALPAEAVLAQDQFVSKDLSATVPANTSSSQPYWLRKPSTIGTFTVDDQQLIGLPVNPPAFPIEVTVEIAGQQIRYTLDTRFRRVDPVAGELHEDLVIAPPVFANFPDAAFVFGDEKSKTIPVKVSASTGAVHGEIHLVAPDGWQVTPPSARIDLNAADDETVSTFTVSPPSAAKEGTLRAVVSAGGKDYSFAREIIDYPHIGSHTLMPPAESKLVRADIRRGGESIGYIPGAGDEIPQCLEQIGYRVQTLAPADITASNLAQFDAVVLGIRAYNTQSRIVDWQKQLLAYVEAGGVVVAQYNTTAELKTKDIGPYPFELSRDRVTDETAEVRILAPDHPVLNTPNKITADDFKGWVQERGLYFPDKWDSHWVPILSSNDPGEKPHDGGLLIAKFGRGYFVYTGYSWFRQLPAGVPGAYRLFANLVSLGKAK